MKFDLIISNPPYNKNLDLKILYSIYQLGTKVCFVHPIGFLYDNKNISNLYVNMKNLLCNDISYSDVIDSLKMFNVIVSADCAIMLYHKNKGTIDINDFDIHGHSDIYKSIKEKLLTYCNNIDNVNNHISNKSEVQKYECGIRHHDAGYQSMIVKRDEHTHVGMNTKWSLKVVMNSKEEALNLKEYLKLKVARFCLTIFQTSRNLNTGELECVPYMPTYEHKWTDEDVAKELGLTDEELKWAINWIPDYYPEDKEKYKRYEI